MRLSTAICWGISLTAMSVAAAILTGCPARADDESAAAGEIVVEDVAATPARVGETSRITFTIRNDGAERVLVTGVDTATSEASRVVGFLGTSHAAAVGSLPVGPGEEVRLGARTAWIEMEPLASDLTPGSRFPARLLLARGSLPLSVHVMASRDSADAGSAPHGQAYVSRRLAPC